MKAVGGSSDIESNVEFTFDLRSALATTAVGSKGTLPDERRCPECEGVVRLSLFLTASQYDAYRVFLTALGIPDAIEFFSGLDIFLRVCLLIFFISYAVAISVHGWIEINLGRASMIYFASFAASLAFYVSERLVGRFNEYSTSLDWAFYLERFGASLYNRKKFAGAQSAILVCAIFIFGACAMCLVMLEALTILTTDNDAAALVLVCSCFAIEVLYTLARLGRFKALSEQGWEASYIASFHTTFTTTLSVPISVVYIVMLVTRQPEM